MCSGVSGPLGVPWLPSWASAPRLPGRPGAPHFSPRRCARLTPPRGVGQPGPVCLWRLRRLLDGLSQKDNFAKLAQANIRKTSLLQSWPGRRWCVLSALLRALRGSRGSRSAWPPWCPPAAGGRSPSGFVCWPPSISGPNARSRASRLRRAYGPLTSRLALMI